MSVTVTILLAIMAAQCLSPFSNKLDMKLKSLDETWEAGFRETMSRFDKQNEKLEKRDKKLDTLIASVNDLRVKTVQDTG